MIKAVIFDLDGILVTFNLNIEACRTKVFQCLIEQDLPRSEYSMTETVFGMLKTTKKISI
jgi:beta-phosphoglucomutase-like phosphatase (HAD superfamily)